MTLGAPFLSSFVSIPFVSFRLPTPFLLLLFVLSILILDKALRFDLVWFPLTPAQVAVGFIVSDELLCLRIPSELAAQLHRDITQVAHAGRAMLANNVGNRLLAGFDAVDEVPHVVSGCLKSARLGCVGKIIVGI